MSKNEKRNIKSLIARWLPAVLLMIVIFIFSAMPGDDSSDTSMKILQPLLNAYSELVHKNVTPDLKEALHHLLRKLAHFSEYALLGISFVRATYDKGERRKKALIRALALSALYACTDEFHQYFVPGRYASPWDVCIDSAGALTGSGILLAIMRKLSIRREKNEEV